MKQNPNTINMVSLSGQVKTVNHYQDQSNKTVFIIQNKWGKFYVEHLGILEVQPGDEVLITGHVFSQANRSVGFNAQTVYVLGRRDDTPG